MTRIRDTLLSCFLDCIKGFAILGLMPLSPLWANEVDLIRTIESIKPSIVGVGTVQKTRSPPVSIMGTGFVLDDGLHVVTSAHVLPDVLDVVNKEAYTVIVGKGGEPQLRAATIVAVDREHDLSLLKIEGSALPAMRIGEASKVKEGQSLAFTGFPIGMILGFYPVTHRAMVSSITPIVLPAHNSRQLNAKLIGQLQKSAYTVFQLDGTAYPGSSGSPLYDPTTGIVYGVINMVFVKGKKEAALSNPSGITYAIPVNYIHELLQSRL
ncbi:serine protease [Nitrosovibrio sp. Nv17]|jgi:S1-C subfamily serine protease|uniref:S1 family peptidase n=1 Tax=Nitrosovibrio sp. Nv17 TaxID=1855339 RepID=UPI000908A689|nr:serine protease [Nitrosovibrio sp. Nv17]SFW28177.1 Trypsin-like peptidase domain-containing protein [Nitrosovibrio sp. Nv17]